ncbi:hypothetical protein ERO13_A11G197300v2 [Gossypium hirsutum]|nr:hypothetical protein ERO13_A11G197300v2 [Gossypium hirsutum]KAG4175667.1 hypothetical protein ERO13_A11G197300v2 [Gossypium hirsutum]TYG94914.1 hypothetical protein ES288_A11G225900v1 [Gossypium darwinii]
MNFLHINLKKRKSQAEFRKVSWAKANLNHTAQGCCHYWCFHCYAYNRDNEMQVGNCPNRAESSGLDDKTKSLVLVNYFHSMSSKEKTCEDNFGDLINMLRTCYAAVGNRWANSVAVDYKRSEGGGSFQAIDTLNGKLL